MKWIFLLFCLISSTAFSQLNNKSILDKLKQTDRLLNKTGSDKLRLDRLIDKSNSGDLQRGTIVLRFNQNQQEIIMPQNQERIVIALRQDNMPCIVPNMNLFKAMPNVGNMAMLQNPIDPRIYISKQKSVFQQSKPSN